MNYDDENWIKVYTRDTAGWLAASWQSRGLALEIGRKLPKGSGELSLGRRGLEALASLLRAPWSEIEPFIRELIADGRLEYDEDAQVIRDPQHVERQNAVTSSAERKRRERERQASRDVTPSHTPSRAVTRRHAESRKEREEEKEKKEEKEDHSTTTPVAVPASKRGTRLPTDWTPAEETQAWARSQGVSDPCGKLLEEFRDFWVGVPGARGTKLDWDATYRNRVRQVTGSPRSSRGPDTRQPLRDPASATWLKTGGSL